MTRIPPTARQRAASASTPLHRAALDYVDHRDDRTLRLLAAAAEGAARSLIDAFATQWSSCPAVNVGPARYQVCRLAAPVTIGTDRRRVRPMVLSYPSLVRDDAVITAKRIFDEDQQVSGTTYVLPLGGPSPQATVPLFADEQLPEADEVAVTLASPHLGYARARYRTGSAESRYELRAADPDELIAFAADYDELVAGLKPIGVVREGLEGHWWWKAPLVLHPEGDRLEWEHGFEAVLAAARRIWARERPDQGPLRLDRFVTDAWIRKLESGLRVTA